MAGTEPLRIQTIGELHQLRGLPRPEHPLISVLKLDDLKPSPGKMPGSLVFDFYSISLKRHCNGKFKYGQHQYSMHSGVGKNGV